MSTIRTMDLTGIDLKHLLVWQELDAEVMLLEQERILDLGMERPLVGRIPAPSANAAVECALRRWRIECAVRGIDSDLANL